MAIVTGLMFMAIGCMVFGIGFVTSTKNKIKAKRIFWSINIWMLSFTVLSGIYNAIFTHTLAPYPLLWGYQYNLILYPAFWLIYVAACISVVLVIVKQERRK